MVHGFKLKHIRDKIDSIVNVLLTDGYLTSGMILERLRANGTIKEGHIIDNCAIARMLNHSNDERIEIVRVVSSVTYLYRKKKLK